MSLNFGGGLFDKSSFLKKEEIQLSETNYSYTIINEGKTITNHWKTRDVPSTKKIKRVLGFQVYWGVYNRSGVAKNMNFILTNETQGTTLKNHSFTVNNGNTQSNSYYYTTEEIDTGDTLKIDFSAGDDLATAAGNTRCSYVNFHITTTFISESERLD